MDYWSSINARIWIDEIDSTELIMQYLVEAKTSWMLLKS